MTKPQIEVTQAWPLNGYAPGTYECKCFYCESLFIGDKRAVSCLACAVLEAKRCLSALQDAAPPAGERIANAGYVRAFYELAALLGISARAASPREVWESEMLPRLKAALTPPAGDVREAALREVLAIARQVAGFWGQEVGSSANEVGDRIERLITKESRHD